MKKTLFIIAAIASCILVCYSMWSFAMMELNPVKWSDPARAFFALIGFMLSLWSAALIFQLYNQKVDDSEYEIEDPEIECAPMQLSEFEGITRFDLFLAASLIACYEDSRVHETKEDICKNAIITANTLITELNKNNENGK